MFNPKQEVGILVKPLGIAPPVLETLPAKEVPGSTPPKDMGKAREVAAEFETLFMDMVLKSMRSTVHGNDKSHALDTYQGMLDSEYSKVMGNHQGLGIQEMILDWMKQNADSQELQGPSKNALLGTKG